MVRILRMNVFNLSHKLGTEHETHPSIERVASFIRTFLTDDDDDNSFRLSIIDNYVYAIIWKPRIDDDATKELITTIENEGVVVFLNLNLEIRGMI